MGTRVASVDILRGGTILAMILVNTPGTWNHIYAPLRHAEWQGLTPTDLVFPFFLYIVGISIYFAYKHKPNTAATHKKIIVRSLKLIGLGLFLNVFLPLFPFYTDLDTVRIPGVLQRIGLVFLVASLLYLNCNWRQIVVLSTVILIGYWLCLGFIPFADGQLPTFDRALHNWCMAIDSKILGQHMWQPDYDPEGLISTIPALVSCLIGVLTGKLLEGTKPLRPLILVAVLLLSFGYVMSLWFPINKAIWSSSFVLVTSGWATLILAVIYYFRDYKGWHFGQLFRYIGMNAITIYFLSSALSKAMYLIPANSTQSIHGFLYDTFFNHALISPSLSSLLYALVVVGCYALLGYTLYKKHIFIKV